MPGKLAALVRAKYPGVYDDLDDATLEQKVLAKYPQYADLAEPDAPDAPARTWVDTATDLLPMAGGMAGGVIGGIGGTVAGMGVGGVPGAIGGSAVGGVAGESLRQVIQALRGQEAPRAPGEALLDIGKEALLQGGSEAMGAGVTAAVPKAARAVYRGYLKPSLAANKVAKANTIVETALNEAIPITRGGSAKAQAVIGDLNREVEQALAQSGGTVDLAQIAARVRAFAKRRYLKPGVDTSDYQMALAVADKIDAHPSLGIPPGVRPTRIDVPLPAANDAKRGLYTSIKEAGFGTPQGAKKTTEKFAANQLKTGIERATGGRTGQVARLNARESKLIDAAKAIAKAVEREANQYPIYGTKTLVAGGAAGGAYAHGDDPMTAIGKGLAVRALLTPGAQTHAAIVANRIAKELGIGAASASRLAAYALSEPQE